MDGLGASEIDQLACEVAPQFLGHDFEASKQDMVRAVKELHPQERQSLARQALADLAAIEGKEAEVIIFVIENALAVFLRHLQSFKKDGQAWEALGLTRQAKG